MSYSQFTSPSCFNSPVFYFRSSLSVLIFRCLTKWLMLNVASNVASFFLDDFLALI